MNEFHLILSNPHIACRLSSTRPTPTLRLVDPCRSILCTTHRHVPKYIRIADEIGATGSLAQNSTIIVNSKPVIEDTSFPIILIHARNPSEERYEYTATLTVIDSSNPSTAETAHSELALPRPIDPYKLDQTILLSVDNLHHFTLQPSQAVDSVFPHSLEISKDVVISHIGKSYTVVKVKSPTINGFIVSDCEMVFPTLISLATYVGLLSRRFGLLILMNIGSKEKKIQRYGNSAGIAFQLQHAPMTNLIT